MPTYGQIIGADNGIEGSWLFELHDDDPPVIELTFIPIEMMPDEVPVSSIQVPIGRDADVLFTEDEAANLALMPMLRSMAELKELDGGSEGTGKKPSRGHRSGHPLLKIPHES